MLHHIMCEFASFLYLFNVLKNCCFHAFPLNFLGFDECKEEKDLTFNRKSSLREKEFGDLKGMCVCFASIHSNGR